MDRYKEALERAKKAVKEGMVSQSFVDDIFGVQESEDERITNCIEELLRKAPLSYFADMGTTYVECFAYLEKQKEQKSIISPEERLGISHEEYNKIVDECIWGEQKEQKKTQSVPDVKMYKKGYNEGYQFGYEIGYGVAQKEQNPDIELIQRSWYMEGYHDRKFGNEPKWIIKTGEGGPKYELNPKYGQPFAEEQKPAEKQDYSGLTELERAIHRGFLCAGVENVPVEIINETAQECIAQMKSAEWSEDCREEDLRTRFAFYTYKDEDSVLYLSNVFVEEASRNKGFGTKILAAAENVAETLGSISIRLKVKQNSPANAWYRKHGYGYMAFEGDYDWLEKTLEYLKPKQEWSEEDEAKKERLISIVKRALHGNEYPILNDNGATELITWLKSLRPQPHWKPSEEQMEALRAAMEHKVCYCGCNHHALKSLYNDLKKLL